MYSIRIYQKENGKAGYELYDVETNEPIARDDSYMNLRKLKKEMHAEDLCSTS